MNTLLERLALGEDVESVLANVSSTSKEFYIIKLLTIQHHDPPLPEEEQLVIDFISRYPSESYAQSMSFRHLLRSLDTASSVSERKRILTKIASTIGSSVFTSSSHSTSIQLPSHLDPDLLNPSTVITDNVYSLSSLSSSALFLLNPSDLTHLSTSSLIEFLGNIPCFGTYPNLFPLVIDLIKKKSISILEQIKVQGKLTRQQLLELIDAFPEVYGNSYIVCMLLEAIIPENVEETKNSAENLTAFYDRLAEFTGKISDKNLMDMKFSLNRMILNFYLSIQKFDEPSFIAFIQLKESLSQNLSVNLDQIFPKYLKPSLNFSRKDLLIRYFILLMNRTYDFCTLKSLLSDSEFKFYYLYAQIITNHPEKDISIKKLGDSSLVDEILNEKFANLFELPLAHNEILEPTKFLVELKNVEKAVVKIYELNTKVYYRHNQSNFDPSINLDSIEPNHVISLDRVNSDQLTTTQLSIPESSKVGVWIVDLVTDSISNRLVISKGTYHVILSQSEFGNHFQIYSDLGQVISNVSAYLAVGSSTGKELNATSSGVVTVPYLSRDQSQSRDLIVFTLNDFDGFSFPYYFTRKSEIFELNLNVLIHPEQLKSRAQIELPIKIDLKCAGEVVNVSRFNLSSVVVKLNQTESRSSILTFDSITFDHNGISLLPLTIPEDLISIEVNVEGKAQSKVVPGQFQSLSQSFSFQVNSLTNNLICAPFLVVDDDFNYTLLIKGRNGEIIPNCKISLEVMTFTLRNPLTFQLISDEKGSISLGKLIGVSSINVIGISQSFSTSFSLSVYSSFSLTNTSCFELGSEPVLRLFKTAHLYNFTLIQKTFDTSSLIDQSNLIVSAHDSSVLLGKITSPGVYSLICSGKCVVPDVLIDFVVFGVESDDVISSKFKIFKKNLDPVYLDSVTSENDHVVLTLSDYDSSTSVHVIQSNFLHNFDPSFFLPPSFSPSCSTFFQPSLFVSRHVSSELLYVDHRQSQSYRSGVILDPPTLQTTQEQVKEVVPFVQGRASRVAEGSQNLESTFHHHSQILKKKSCAVDQTVKQNSAEFSVEFLKNPSILKFDCLIENGKVKIPKHFGPVNVIIQSETSYSSHLLPGSSSPALDDVSVPFSALTSVDQGLVVKETCVPVLRYASLEIQGGNVAIFSSISQIFDLIIALTKTSDLDEFSWLKKWPKLSKDEKLAKYSGI
ncbi:hypothetical protein RCL1_005801 [Eukaryota sp. TZLM3-RCL]